MCFNSEVVIVAVKTNVQRALVKSLILGFCRFMMVQSYVIGPGLVCGMSLLCELRALNKGKLRLCRSYVYCGLGLISVTVLPSLL